MKHTIYLQAKAQLIERAKELKGNSDKNMVRQSLNDLLGNLLRGLYFETMRENISTKTYVIYNRWLENLCCSLHP